MQVQIFSSSRVSFQRHRLQKSLEALLQYLKLKGAVLEVQLVGLRRIQTLNAQYLKKDKVTDVLSFPQATQEISPKIPWILGEIVIALPVAAKQARASGRNLTAQIVRLAIHGLVHLQGFDHEEGPLARQQFEALERRYLDYLDRKGILKWNGFLPLSAESSLD